MKKNIQHTVYILLISLMGFKGFGQATIQKSQPFGWDFCGDQSGSVMVSNIPGGLKVKAWQEGSYDNHGVFSVLSTTYTASLAYNYNLQAPVVRTFRVVMDPISGSGAESYSYATLTLRKPVGGTVFVSGPSTFYKTGTGTIQWNGRIGTPVVEKSNASATITSTGGGTYQFTVTESTSFSFKSTDGNCSSAATATPVNGIEGGINIKVEQPGVITGPTTVVEESWITLLISKLGGTLTRWEYSLDNGSTWIQSDNQLPRRQRIVATTKFRALVTMPTYGSEYTDPFTVTMTPYTQTLDPINGQNSVREQQVIVSGITHPSYVDPLPATQKREVITYLDGAGRTIQTNIRKGSPMQKDIISVNVYDDNGRQATTYLPYVSTSDNGSYRTNPLAELMPYYTNGTGDKVQDTYTPYAVTVFEKSPVGRVTEQGSVGENWQPGGGHTTLINFSHNVTNEVRQFKNDGTSTGFYNANELVINESIDEDQKKRQAFVDKEGHTILTRVQLDETVEGVSVPWLETYYIYYPTGVPRYIISPKGVAALKTSSWSFTQALKDQYVHEFIYDERGRVIQKKVPGQAWIYYCYDRLDRLVLLQDGNLRSQNTNKWFYMKYDRNGRIVQQGVYTNTSAHTTREALQLNVINPLYQNVADPFYETVAGNTIFPTTNTEPLVRNYYDGYGPGQSYIPQGLVGEGTPVLTGMLTYSERLIIGTSTWLGTFYFYDADNRIIQIQSRNHLQSANYDVTTIVYDFEGKPTLKKTFHDAGSGKATTVLNKLSYDHMGRQQSVVSSILQPVNQPLVYNVQWTNAVNVIPDGNSLSKTGGTNNVWDAGAFSVQSIPANTDGWVEFVAGETTAYKMMGLSVSDGGAGYNTINYALYVYGNSNLYIYESGTQRGASFGTYTAADILRVERQGSTVVYKKNGNIFYTSTVPASGVLYADCSFYSIPSSFKNVTLTSSPWKNNTGVTINGNTLTKTGGVANTWDAGVFSNQSIPASKNGWVEFTAGETSTNKMLGLSGSDGNASYTSISYAWYVAAGGLLYIYENGSQRGGGYGVYSTTDVLRIEREGTTVVYKKNGIVLYTSAMPSSGALFADCSFYSTGASLKNINIGSSDVEIARYEYNELGQLVDKKLHNTGGTYLQSVDYRYNIKGQLKSINNAQLANNAANDDSNDYFGMEYLYHEQETGLTTSTDVFYNGNISAIKWKGVGATSSTSIDQSSYKFTYDKANRLKTATSQLYTGSTWTKEAGALNESTTYDQNGNILTLQRNQRKYQFSGTASYGAETIDNLTYLYNTSMNDQLLRVTDASAKAAGFDNGTSATANDYTYDANTGNLLTDNNKGVSGVVYNLLGKVSQITFSDGRKVEYVYDAAGTKLTMKTFAAGNAVPTVTDYANGFVYENTILSFFGSPEGRVVMNGNTPEYQYSITDHQGNTRVIFSSVNPTTTPVTATFENIIADAQAFQNVRTSTTYWVPKSGANNTSGGQYVLRMNNSYPTGPSKSLKVFPGDVIYPEVYAYFEGSSGFGANNQPLTTLITSIAGAFGGVQGAGGESGLIYSRINTAITNVGSPTNQGDGQPTAHLNYILYDKDFNLLNIGWSPVPASANMAKQKVTLNPITVKEVGYIYVYLSYSGEGTNWVYFDDFKITHNKTNVIQYNDYYPFGLQASTSWTRDNTTENNFLYNEGSELNKTSGWYETMARNYDPTLGRFTGIDPLATQYASVSGYHYSGNNPVMINDPTGASYQPGYSKNGMNVSPSYGNPNWGNYEDVPSWAGTPNSFGSIPTGLNSFGHTSSSVERAQKMDLLNRARNGDIDAVKQYGAMNGDLYSSSSPASFFTALTADFGNVTVGDGRVLAQNITNGDYAQIDQSGNPFVPYTNTSYWDYVGGRALDKVQSLFDYYGTLPLIGEVFDGINASIYTLRGDYVNASLSGAAMIPIAGWAATGAKAIQRHHVIPNAVFKKYINELTSIGWVQNAGINLKRLPTPFHGNHPSYSNYVVEQIENLKAAGNLNLHSLNGLQHQLRQEINSIYLGGSSSLNGFYKKLGY